ncbi:MFS transporter [Longispora sp. K20-0274]|uniref:MFS transporter n=1 Tax=Longispora sp. K20-0274 TaxID=3088255 RepID=UPI0039998017
MLDSVVASFLINRDFARLWSGQAISVVGDFVFDTTLTIWVAKELLAGSRWAPAAVSGLMLCTVLAIMVVGPVAGVFVDRWDRKRLMLGTEVLRGVLVGALTLVTLLPTGALPTGVWLALLYFVVFVVNAAGQFFNPARFATIGEIVPGEADRARAFGLGQATQSTAVIIGPPLAAPLLFSVGIQWALLLNAVSYAVSFLAIRGVRVKARPAAERAARQSWRAEFGAGLRMFATNRFLVALLGIAVIAQLGTGAINALDIFFLTDNLHAEPKLLGVMSMAIGVGSVVGALLSGRMVALVGARNVTWGGLFLGGLLFAVYARQTSFTPALIVAVAFMIPITALNTGLSPLLLQVTPPDYMGRMAAVFTPVNNAASMLSVVVAGSLASTTLRDFHASVAGVHVGRIDLIFTVSALLVTTAGVIGAFVLPPARREKPA